MVSCVYRLVNMVNDDFYIGSAVNFRRRKWEHLAALKRGDHHCKALQAAVNAHGLEFFEFEILQEVDASGLRRVEDMFLLQHAGRPECYNTMHSTSTPPGYMESVRKKISDSMKLMYATEGHPRTGTTHSEETRAKISASRVGKMAGEKHYRFGKTLSEEVRKKIGDTQRGVAKAPRIISEDGKRRIAAAVAAGHYDHWTGRKHTAAAKAKMSKTVIAVNADGVETTYASLTALRETLNLAPAVVNNALKSGVPLKKGRYAGWTFRYAVI